MGADTNHVIRRQTLEFDGVKEADAHQLQEELSSLFHTRILPLLEAYLSAHSPGDVVHRIDRLELDIGNIYRHDLTEDCINKLTRQLEIHFQPQQQSEIDFKTEKAEISSEKSHVQLFRFFIETGSLPWWVDSKSPDPVKESLDFLIREHRSGLLSLMYHWVYKPDSIKRIVFQTGFPKWVEIAALNMDCTAAELTSLLSQLMDLLKKIPPWNEYSRHKLQESIGLKLLPWVYLSRRKMRHDTAFWESFLAQLATGQGIKYDALLVELSRQFENKSQLQTDRDNNQLSNLFIFFWQGITPTGSLQARLFEQIKNLLSQNVLSQEKKTQWLEYLRRLNKQVVEDKDLEVISDLLEQAVAGVPDKSDADESVEEDGLPLTISWKGITPTGSFQAKLFEQIKYLLEIKVRSTEKKTQWLEYLRRLNEQVIEDKDLKVISELLEQAIEDEQDLPGADQEANPESIDMTSDDFSDTEELFVGNAGLVIFWPYLTRFFEELDLIADRQFTDVASTHRAVGLTQYLVDGQDIPSEHQCGLNKILCGLDAETVLDFGEPVTVEEAEVCESLLQAVITNATVLGEMSIEGFRGTFLIRNGTLRAGAGVWELNVERASYDVVLERFPWSWSIVKLPWMKWPIVVEWV